MLVVILNDHFVEYLVFMRQKKQEHDRFCVFLKINEEIAKTILILKI